MKDLINNLEDFFGNKPDVATFLGYTLRHYSNIRKNIMTGEQYKLRPRVIDYIKLKCRELDINNGKKAV